MAEQPNSALSTLKGVAGICLGVGAVLLVIGFVGHDQPGRPSYLDPAKEISYGPLVVGGALLSVAFQAWMLLLLFWALQHDRATRASYTPPVVSPSAGPAPVIPNRAQREAVRQQSAAKVPMTWTEES